MAFNNEAMFAHRALLAMRILGVQKKLHRYWHFTAGQPHQNVIAHGQLTLLRKTGARLHEALLA
jgi:hypothetical protein